MAPALVLLHGFTQTGASWDGVRAALGERYAEVLAPDLRGHGAARAVRPVDVAGVLEDLESLVPARATLAGYSLGGRLALHFALAHPGRLGRLVLLGASPGLADRAARAGRGAADEERARTLEREGLEAFVAGWERLPLWAGQPEAVRTRARTERLGQNPAGLAAALRGLGAGTVEPVWDRLGELDLPVTLLAGERDAKFLALAEEMALRLPQAAVHALPAAGHAAHLEAPQAVAARL